MKAKARVQGRHGQHGRKAVEAAGREATVLL